MPLQGGPERVTSPRRGECADSGMSILPKIEVLRSIPAEDGGCYNVRAWASLFGGLFGRMMFSLAAKL